MGNGRRGTNPDGVGGNGTMKEIMINKFRLDEPTILDSFSHEDSFPHEDITV